MRETTRGARAGRSVRGAVVGAVATIILGWGAPAAATTFNVNTTGDEARHATAPTCVCRTGPRGDRCTLRAAVQTANVCPGHDVITLDATGIYHLTIPGASEDAGATGDLDVHEGITLIGNGRRVQAEVEDRLFDLTVPATDLVEMIEVDLARGDVGGVGGAIRSDGGDLTLDNVRLESSRATVAGGGLYMSHGELLIIDSTIQLNAAGDGGGAYLDAAVDADLQGVHLDQNSADVGGGLVAHSSGPLSIDDCLFTSNQATAGPGGGLFVVNPDSALVAGTTFVGNFASADGGGAVLVPDVGPVMVRSCLFDSNEALDHGGGLVGAGTVEQSAFSANRAELGGALATSPSVWGYLLTSDLEVRNSTIHRNTATVGAGGTMASGPTVLLEHVTCDANTAPAPGPSAHMGSVHLRATIVSGSTSGQALCQQTTSLGHNVSLDASCAGAPSDQVVSNAGLGGYGAWGGPTPSVPLQSSSPALDAASLATCPPVDQRGYPRPSGRGCDVGSFEL